MMEKRLTLAFWAVLLGVAAWQSPNWWASATDPRIDTGPVPPVAEAPAPAPAPGPRKTASNLDRYKVRDPEIPYKIDLRNYKQNTPFLPTSKPVEEGARLTTNAPGNSGPFDSDGKLIVPLDPRNEF